MKSKISGRLVLSGIILALTLTGGIAPALAQPGPIPVSQCGQVLNEPGKYVLTTDLVPSFFPNPCGGPIVTIATDNIDFNLNGHDIFSGPNNFAASILLVDGISNVLIHNESQNGGVVIGEERGIVMSNDRNITISGLTIGGPAITSPSFNSLVINGGSDLRITGNTLQDNAGDADVYAVGVSNSVFSGNVLTEGSNGDSDGFFLGESSTGNMVSGNTITYGRTSGGDAIVLGAGTSGNMVRNNIIVDPDTFGIDLELGARDNSIKSNTVTGGVYDGNGPPCVNSWKTNTFTFASGAVACIH